MDDFSPNASERPEQPVQDLDEIVSRGRRRRRQDRRVLDVPVEVEFVDHSGAGRTRDLSQSGLLFVSDDRVRVRVSFEVDGEHVVREGRLVRAQPMAGGKTAYALQFDDDREPLE
ncbi:MAG: PilZ domain-containing protein [Planctomycetota bacterium]|jgi:hypothetical protein